jgi:hypothetical protein
VEGCGKEVQALGKISGYPTENTDDGGKILGLNHLEEDKLWYVWQLVGSGNKTVQEVDRKFTSCAIRQ